MVKFIASDLDGTLLPPSKILPEETFGVIDRLYEKGILFAPASGRQLPNLKKLFAPVLDKIAIIAENGALVWYGDTVFTNPTPKDGVKRALALIREEKGLYPLFSCAECAYYEDDFPPFVNVAKKSYSNVERANLDEIAETQTVMKISVWDETPPCAEHGGIILPPKISGLRTVVSGYDWLDVSSPTSNKGEGLEALLKILKIDKSECMAFGDHMNDLELLQACGQPYVTENAFPALQEIFKNRVPSNAEHGVLTKIKEFL